MLKLELKDVQGHPLLVLSDSALFARNRTGTYRMARCPEELPLGTPAEIVAAVNTLLAHYESVQRQNKYVRRDTDE